MPKKVKRDWKPYYCNVRNSWVVPLTMGLETLIDEEDLPLVEPFMWQASKVASTNKRDYIYAASYFGRKSIKQPLVYLHRFLMNPKRGQVIDHLNGDTLDNRKSNLRVCTQRENMCNQMFHRSGKLVGAQRRDNGKFASRIKIDGKYLVLGTFNTEFEAHQAYLDAYNELIEKKKSAA